MALVPAEVKGGRLPLHNAMPACITTQHAHTHTACQMPTRWERTVIQLVWLPEA